jgi:hypothetical protein
MRITQQPKRFALFSALGVGALIATRAWRRSTLEQDADERMPHGVESAGPQPGLLHDGAEDPAHLRIVVRRLHI